jgi:lariat debranching enzyme
MNEPYESTYFAAAGDVHGHMHALVDLIESWEHETNQAISFVLQTGDFEPHRNAKDLQTMAAPAKYKRVGDFPNFVSGHSAFPWPVYFIGGNHEPYGFLDQYPTGEWIVSNCRYLGRVGQITLAGLRIVFLSGIFRERDFPMPRPSVDIISKLSNKVFTAFTEADVERALSFESADILLLHDWPSDIVHSADEERFKQQCRRLRYEHLGNPYSRMLVELLAPQLVLCGHIHMPYEAEIEVAGGSVAKIRCLGRVDQGREGLAVFRIDVSGKIYPVI